MAFGCLGLWWIQWQCHLRMLWPLFIWNRLAWAEAETKPQVPVYLQGHCPSNNGLWESAMRSTFYFRSGYSFPKCAAARRAWIQIQLDLRNVQDLWCFQALLHSSPDGKSQTRLCHDQHQALPPAQPGPEDVTQLRLDALCLNQSNPCRNAPSLLWIDGQSSWSCLSEIKIRIKLAFCPSWELLLWCLISWVVSLPMVGGLELDKVLPVQTILWLWDLIRKCDMERDPYQWDSEHVNSAPCAETSPHLLSAAELFHRISHHSCLRICSHFDTSAC